MSSEHKSEPRTPLGRGGKNIMDKKKMSVAASPAQHHKDSDTSRRSTTSPRSQGEIEMSDDDSPLPQSHSDPVGNRRTTSSSLQGAAAQMEHKKSGTPITQEIMSKEFWMDKKFLTQMMILGTLQALMIWGVHASLQGSITDLKACSRSSSDTDNSLPCSDCMCIATDGFSSAQFKNIIKDQENLSMEFKQKTKEQEEMESRLTKVETRTADFIDLSDMKYRMKNLDSEIKEMMFTMENLIESRINDKLVRMESNIDEKVKSEVQEKSTNLEKKLQDVRGEVKESEGNMGRLVENERRQRESILKEVMNSMSELKTSAFKNFTEVESKYKGMEGQIKHFFREPKDITEFINTIKEQETLLREFKQKVKKQEEMETRLKETETKTTDFQDLSDKKYTMQNLDSEIKDMPKNLQKEIMFTLENFTESRIKEKLDNIDEKIKIEVQEKSANLERRLIQDIQGQVMASEEKMDKRIDDERKMRESNIKEVMGNMSELKTSASEVMSNISELKTSIFENFTKVESMYEGMKGQLDYFFREIKDINIYIVGFLLVLVMGVIYVAYKILLGRPPHGEDRIRQVTQDPLPRSRVGGHSPAVNVERITKKSLDRSIGMISFNASTKEFHQSLMNEVPKSRYVDVQPCLIHRSNEIPQIVPSKFVFIFVDFNEKNIILEDSDTEIRDLRRPTTQGVLNMGCDVFVVYVRDRGSTTLRPGQLYNPQLYSVEQHPLLSKLKERNRVLSVYDSFLPHQVKFLEDCLKGL